MGGSLLREVLDNNAFFRWERSQASLSRGGENRVCLAPMNHLADAKCERATAWLRAALLLASAAIPLSLLWDYSWESTIGIDLVWSPPHVTNDLGVALAGCAATALLMRATREGTSGVRIGRWVGPLGAWLAIWGACAFGTSLLFDRWWQSSYGMAAGIWHPPQLLKAAAFFAVTLGAWFCCRGRLAFAAAGGGVLTMISVVTLASIFPNRQHGALFFQVACATYPIVLVALATAGSSRLSATLGAAIYFMLIGAMVWLLPLVPAEPQVAPIYNPRDHLLPPPFPLLLIVPAFALDALLRFFPGRTRRFENWSRAAESGLTFFFLILVTQWLFAQFLLMPASDHWFFAGGGKQWPFFLKIHPSARTVFWKIPGEELTLARSLGAAALAVLAARVGLWLGAAMKRI